MKVEEHHTTLEENGVRLSLTVVDTPGTQALSPLDSYDLLGYGDAVNNSNCWNPILEYLEEKFEEFLEGETRVNRNHCKPDTRVHACLYFIAPTGGSLIFSWLVHVNSIQTNQS